MVREALGAVSTQAIYDVLSACTAADIVCRFEPAGSRALYELRAGDDNHHHLVCRSCAAVQDVECAIGAAPCLEPADHRGFSVDEAEVVYWGTCRSCEAVDRPATSRPIPKER